MRAITFRALHDRACIKHVLETLCTVIPPPSLPDIQDDLKHPEICHSFLSANWDRRIQQQLHVQSVNFDPGQRSYSTLTAQRAAGLHQVACMSTGAGPASAASTSMPLAPGSQVIIDMSLSSRDVQVLVNDDPEAMSWEDSSGLHVESVGPDRVAVRPRQPGTGSSCPIVLRVPPRFCSLDITTGGGSVHVQAVKEGSLTVESCGGDVHVGSMGGAIAEVLTAGGAVTGSLTAEKMFVHTDSGTGGGSGKVRLDKVLAKEAVILTRDLDSSASAARPQEGAKWGGVHITALYAEEAHIKAGGAPVSVGTMSCSGCGTILSGGSPVSIGGLDGSLNIISGGGAVELQLQKNVMEVHVNSNADANSATSAVSGQASAPAPGGAISCKIDPAVDAVLATCCADLDVDSTLPFEALAVKDHVVTARIGPDVSAPQPAGHQDQAPGAAQPDEAQRQTPSKHIVLDAGSAGRVSVSARSWADSIRDKFGSGAGSGRGAAAPVGSEAWVPPS